ncbi:MAG: hypothetical protein JRE18_04190, partial [Deltaproteobacteria bacterium]|nr:hypothetical protein [Deltaproteobacteria bacterium]
QRTFEALAPDNALRALETIQDLFGTSRAIPEPGERLEVPPAEPDEIRQVRDDAAAVLDELNRFRSGLGLSALLEVSPMTDVAEGRATEMYTSGTLFLTPDCFRDLSGSGVRAAACGETVALAGTALGALDGMIEDANAEADLSSPLFDRAGISVTEGPTGRLVVIVLGG